MAGRARVVITVTAKVPLGALAAARAAARRKMAGELWSLACRDMTDAADLLVVRGWLDERAPGWREEDR